VKTRVAASLALAALAAAGGAQAAVFRCVASDGAVTYQDSECPRAASGQATNIPTDFPPVTEARRAELMQREAELQRRLEAQRERDDRMAAMRLAAAPATPTAPQYDDDVYPVYFPLGIGGRPKPPHMRPHPSPRSKATPPMR
jgi:hypothetical protein